VQFFHGVMDFDDEPSTRSGALEGALDSRIRRLRGSSLDLVIVASPHDVQAILESPAKPVSGYRLGYGLFSDDWLNAEPLVWQCVVQDSKYWTFDG